MLIDYKRTAAYICRECSGINKKEIDIFTFSGKKKVDLFCENAECGAKCIGVRKKQDSYVFDVECPVCGGTHSMQIGSSGFWNNEITAITCPISDIDIFVAGTDEAVADALEQLKEFEEEQPDESVLYDMLEELYMMSAEHAISCVCGNENIEATVMDGAIALVCKRCGAAKIIEISRENLDKIMASDSLIISK